MTELTKECAINDLQKLCEDLPVRDRLALAQSSIVLSLICDDPNADPNLRSQIRALRDLPDSTGEAELRHGAERAIKTLASHH